MPLKIKKNYFGDEMERNGAQTSKRGRPNIIVEFGISYHAQFNNKSIAHNIIILAL